MMAALYANENDRQKSREIYEQVLKNNSNDHDALVGMMRLELLRGDKKAALSYLERAVATSSKDGRLAKIELSMVAMMKGNLKEAKSLLLNTTEENPKDLLAWSLLAAVAMQQWDAAKDEKVKASLRKDIAEKYLSCRMQFIDVSLALEHHDAFISVFLDSTPKSLVVDQAFARKKMPLIGKVIIGKMESLYLPFWNSFQEVCMTLVQKVICVETYSDLVMTIKQPHHFLPILSETCTREVLYAQHCSYLLCNGCEISYGSMTIEKSLLSFSRQYRL
jgi:hypothetical protein